jgi:large subunit ribosomal protein L6
MSRIGKKIITIPTNVTFNFDEINRVVLVRGPLGELKLEKINKVISFSEQDKVLSVKIADENNSSQKAIWGTTRALVSNLIEGVTNGFKKELELNGVGYKMELNNKLTLFIGFSHPVVLDIPAGIKLSLNKNILSGESTDKHLIGDFFTNVHNMKPCEVYKHKGFKFPGRIYRKKVGKKGK